MRQLLKTIKKVPRKLLRSLKEVYYKICLVLKNELVSKGVTDCFQKVSAITKCNSYYKVRRKRG